MIALACLLAIAGLVPLVVGWNDLPDPVTTHWGPNGLPDGTTAQAWLWVLPVGLAALGLVVAWSLRTGDGPSAEGVALLGFLGSMGIWSSGIVVVANQEAPTWEEAAPFGWWQVLGLLAFSALAGWLCYLLGKRWYPPRPVAPESQPTVFEIPEDLDAAWTGMLRVWWPFGLLLPIGAVFLFLPSWLPWLAPLYVALAFLLSRVAVRVDRIGMRVKLGGFLTVRKITLEEIRAARRIALEPKDWGGWGYRMVPGGSAVVLRRGDAIEIGLRNDRRFAVTVDDAATGAALLNGFLARTASG
jgi:hypothetical protein